jgi:transposase
MTAESATDGDVFPGYPREMLSPILQAGQVVAMDNLAAHKVDGARELIGAAGAEMRYLRPTLPTSTPSNPTGR